MSVELIGKVLKIGKIKDYGFESNWGKKWTEVPRFFMQIQTDAEVVNVMVDCKAEQTQYGYRIPKEEPRQRPFIGDTVKITTQRLRQGKDGISWASVTWNQTIEVVKENPEARAELQAFIEKKKQEREDAFKAKVAESKQKRVEAKLARKAELEQQKNDERLPETLRNEITESFDIIRIKMLLRDTKWFAPIEEGEGGKRAVYSLSGAIEAEGYAGNGMRRPSGALYNLPQSVRASVLSKAIRAGIIAEKDGRYSATELGKELLIKLDSCTKCNQQRKPYHTTSHYTMPGSWSSSRDVGITFHCDCEIKEQYDSQRSCNAGVSFTPAFKEKKKEE